MRRSRAHVGINHIIVRLSFVFVLSLLLQSNMFLSNISPLNAQEETSVYKYELVACKAQDQACTKAREEYDTALEKLRSEHKRLLNVLISKFDTYLEGDKNDKKNVQLSIGDFSKRLEEFRTLGTISFSKDDTKGMSPIIKKLKKIITKYHEYHKSLQQQDLGNQIEKRYEYWNAIKTLKDASDKFTSYNQAKGQEYVDKFIYDQIESNIQALDVQKVRFKALRKYLDDEKSTAHKILKIHTTLTGPVLVAEFKKAEVAYNKENEEFTGKLEAALKAGAIKIVTDQKPTADEQKKQKVAETTITIIKAQYGVTKDHSKNCKVTGLLKRNCEKVWGSGKFCIKKVGNNYQVELDNTNCPAGSEKLETGGYDKQMCSIPVGLKAMCGDHHNPAPNSQNRKLFVDFKCGEKPHDAYGRDGKELILYCPYHEDSKIDSAAVTKRTNQEGYKP